MLIPLKEPPMPHSLWTPEWRFRKHYSKKILELEEEANKKIYESMKLYGSYLILLEMFEELKDNNPEKSLTELAGMLYEILIKDPEWSSSL
jgi:hypothetical protein